MAKPKEKKNRTVSEVEEGEPNVKEREELETMHVKIQAIGEIPDKKTPPIVGYFPSGYDPVNDSEPQSNSSVEVYRSASSRNPKNPRMQVVVGARRPGVNFVGTNYSGEATTPQLCNYMLGVLDKETRVLKMVPIAANRVMIFFFLVGFLFVIGAHSWKLVYLIFQWVYVKKLELRVLLIVVYGIGVHGFDFLLNLVLFFYFLGGGVNFKTRPIALTRPCSSLLIFLYMDWAS